MIPLKLQLKNFLSYGNTIQTIDFTRFKLICLSGRNGHGKSALLDAITWALWGQARKIGATSKPDDGILRLGQVEMMVCFDFIFNGQTYRVKRDYSKKYGKPHAHVDFGLLDTEDHHFIPLTDKTIRKTQLKIESILGLDYESFINSSFLRQGQANEFSKKSAKERKEVLATILGLNQYDRARTCALEKIRTLTNEKHHLEKLDERINLEQQQGKDIPLQLATLDTNLKNILNKEKEYTTRIKMLEEQKKECAAKRNTDALLSLELSQLTQQENEKKEQLLKTKKAWQTFHGQFLKHSDQKILKEKKHHLLEEMSLLQQTVQKALNEQSELLKIKEKKSALEKTLTYSFEKQQHELLSAYERLTAKKEHLQKTLLAQANTQREIEEKIHLFTKKISEQRKYLSPDALLSESRELKKNFERKREFYQRWIEQGNWINTELNNLAQKQTLSQDVANPSCPLCEQNLSQARKRFLQKKFSLHSTFLNHRFNRLRTLIEKLKSSLKKHHQELEIVVTIEKITQEQEIQKQERTKINQLIKTTTQEIETCNNECITLKTQKEKLEYEKVALFNANTDLKKYTLQIETMENNIQHKNSSDRFSVLSQELKIIEQELHTYETLKEQTAAQEERKKTVTSLCIDLKKIVCTKKQLEEKRKPFLKLHEQELQLEQQKTETETLLKDILEKKEEQLTEKGRLETEQKKQQQLTIEQKTLKQKLSLIETSTHEYTIMSKALGKDGIQALLIEEALPEIEQEANALLARLTDNQATIHIESLRDLKKGGTRETLDINISDDTGIRPYELFSGGEAFRIDFALRIAISKLLARRAGTSLQTLIIDEGFGSQDEEGLSRIMDALYAVQDDFEKIIIVSHLSSMKDQFPVHFFVEKRAQGSHVIVIEQG